MPLPFYYLNDNSKSNVSNVSNLITQVFREETAPAKIVNGGKKFPTTKKVTSCKSNSNFRSNRLQREKWSTSLRNDKSRSQISRGLDFFFSPISIRLRGGLSWERGTALSLDKTKF